jgi:hypothetical protein
LEKHICVSSYELVNFFLIVLFLVFFLGKPSATFWNELQLFINSRGDVYKGDGRTKEDVGTALGLNQIMMQQVQQDAEKPDKVAMNIWRKICSSRADQLYVGSILNVPATTLNDIYGRFVICINIK